MLHNKEQQAIGAKLATSFMDKLCLVNLTAELGHMGHVPETFTQRVVTHFSNLNNKRTDASHVVFLDFSKYGRLTQGLVNMMVDYSAGVMSSNMDTGCCLVISPLLASETVSGGLRGERRRIEDRFLAREIELRPFSLLVDKTPCHGNRELPVHFPGWIGVHSMSLSRKGTGHKAKAEETGTEETKQSEPIVNQFVKSELWRLQGNTAQNIPTVLKEEDFVVPCMQGEHLRSNDTRRSLTQVQETSQWVAGESISTCLLMSLLNGVDVGLVILHNLSPYDSFVERAVHKLSGSVSGNKTFPKMASLSITTDSVIANFVTSELKRQFIEEWKNNMGPLANEKQRFEPHPRSPTAPPTQEPVLKVCTIADGNLGIPMAVRNKYLTDAVRGPEWRKFLTNFDATYQVQGPAKSTIVSVSINKTDGGEEASSVKGVMQVFDVNSGVPGFEWDKAFGKDEPTTIDQLTSMTDKKDAEMKKILFDCEGNKKIFFTLLPETDKLYLCCKEATTLSRERPIITHGGGVWKLKAAGAKWAKDSPNKGYRCLFANDLAPVVVEQNSDSSRPKDGNLTFLRIALQDLEKQGKTEFELSGHKRERPQTVKLGQEDDRFEIAANEDPMIWVPTVVTKESLIKQHNVASVFADNKTLQESALEVVWRMRYYEKFVSFGPAKPLWFLKKSLSLPAGGVQRIV